MTIATNLDIKKMSKEHLHTVVFQNVSGKSGYFESRTRNRKLHLSILLTNHPEADVQIVFNTTEGYKEIKAAIWGATDKFILLKGGSFIPVESVAYVSLEA